MNQPRVIELWIYPIKSCRGIQVQKLEIDACGPKYDRQWMIVDDANKFMTLRNQSHLALIKTQMDNENLFVSFDAQTFSISLNIEPQKTEIVTVWADSFLAGIEADEINNALTEFIGEKVKLVRYQKESFRDLKAASTDVISQMRFADSRPILLTNENSLKDLNEKLLKLDLEPSVMERFRANIIITGVDAFSEDQANQVKVGPIQLVNPKLCSRCPVITQDVTTGKVVSKETLLTLAQYRKINGNKVMFGVNYTPANTGVILINDVIQFSHC
ncbi:MAG: MOSC N-terminal beta barrel domain-containing protein [Pseudobdellovibrio sp.]